MKFQTAVCCSVLLLAIGCAGSGRSRADSTVASVTTVDHELAQAQAQMDTTVTLLGSVTEASGPAFAPAYDKFVAALDLLDERTQSVRDRATAMAARRDEYLKHWLEQTSTIQSAELRAQAEQRRTQLMQVYMELNARAAALKKSYAPLQLSLHDCSRFLESDPNGAQAKGLVAEVEKIHVMQKEVNAAAQSFRDGLKAITEKIATAAPAPSPDASAPAPKK